ncbi:helix-turn-helix domain-containing protein [Brevundimonas sp.]|uniref:helix-turn-helix domain-containing protein n=1 Tax=Brevundimonas sp. TaxID=1871086 RepID=UPI0039175BE9
MQTDSPIRWVRKNVFKATQDALAEIGGVSRPRVSRYENGEGDPPFDFLRRLRSEAHRRGVEFSGDWFFEVPNTAAPVHVRAREDVQ